MSLLALARCCVRYHNSANALRDKKSPVWLELCRAGRIVWLGCLVIYVSTSSLALAITPELKHIVFMELEFVKRVCQLNPDQQRVLEELDDKWIESVTTDVGTQRFANGFVRVLGLGPNADPALPKAKANALVVQLNKQIDKLLNEDQKQQLADERKLREDFKKDAMLELLLICLDRNVGLTTKQQESLKNDLKLWARSMDLHATSYLINERFVPSYPSAVLRRHLTTSQMTILNSLQRIDFSRSGGAVQPVGMLPGLPAGMIRN